MAKQIPLDDLWPLLERHTEKIPSAIRVSVQRTLLEMVRFVTKAKLSFSREGPPHPGGLRVQTGTARRSVQYDVRIFGGADRVIGRLGSPLRYVRTHELGFRGSVQVPAHIRRLVALERSARTGKVTKKSARAYKAALTSGRKTTAQVRAHSRRVNFAARRFFRATLDTIGPRLPVHARKSLDVLAKQGRVPSLGEL